MTRSPPAATGRRTTAPGEYARPSVRSGELVRRGRTRDHRQLFVADIYLPKRRRDRTMTDGVDPHASRTELTGQRLAEVNQGTLEFLSGPATRLPHRHSPSAAAVTARRSRSLRSFSDAFLKGVQTHHIGHFILCRNPPDFAQILGAKSSPPPEQLQKAVHGSLRA
jgi:hypothetical protein